MTILVHQLTRVVNPALPPAIVAMEERQVGGAAPESKTCGGGEGALGALIRSG